MQCVCGWIVVLTMNIYLVCCACVIACVRLCLGMQCVCGWIVVLQTDIPFYSQEMSNGRSAYILANAWLLQLSFTAIIGHACSPVLFAILQAFIRVLVLIHYFADISFLY
jgi:hypothetical protein